MGLLKYAQDWSAQVAVRKVVVHVVNVVVAWLIAHGATKFLMANGATIDDHTLQNILTALFTGALTAFRDWLHLRTGWTWL